MKGIISTLILGLCIAFSVSSRCYCSEYYSTRPMYQRSEGIKSHGGRTDLATAILVFYSIPVVRETLLNAQIEGHGQANLFARFLSDNIKRLNSGKSDFDFSTFPSNGAVDLPKTLDFIGVCIKILGVREMKPFKFLGVKMLFDKSDGPCKRDITEIRFWKTFRVGSGYQDLSSAIKDNFAHETVSEIIKKRYPNLRYAFLYKTIPEVLMFYLYHDNSTSTDGMTLEKSLKVDRFEFQLATRVIYNRSCRAIEVVSHDFGNDRDYLYRNTGEVIELPVGKESEYLLDYDTHMLFYVKTSTVALIKSGKNCLPVLDDTVVVSKKRNFENSDPGDSVGISQSLKQARYETSEIECPPQNYSNSNETFPQNASTYNFELNLSSDLAEKLKQIYWDNIEDVREDAKKYTRALHEKILSNISSWPVERLDLLSKFNSPNYYLGQSNYSFKPSSDGFHYSALEIILTALASDVSSFSKLIKSAFRKESKQMKKEFILVLVKMNLGMKNISLDKLERQFVRNGFILKSSKSQFSFIEFINIVNVMNRCGSNSFIEATTAKTIEYQGLDTEIPINLPKYGTQLLYLKYNIKQPSYLNIEGVWSDFELPERPNRFRRIYKSDCTTFFINIDRKLSASSKELSSAKFERIENGYSIVGAVFLDNINNAIEAVFKNDFSEKSCRIYRSNSVPSVHLGSIEDFAEKIDHHAVMIFYSKTNSRPSKSVYASSITQTVYEMLDAEYQTESRAEIRGNL